MARDIKVGIPIGKHKFVVLTADSVLIDTLLVVSGEMYLNVDTETGKILIR